MLLLKCLVIILKLTSYQFLLIRGIFFQLRLRSFTLIVDDFNEIGFQHSTFTRHQKCRHHFQVFSVTS
jgi:hypothetical protein